MHKSMICASKDASRELRESLRNPNEEGVLVAVVQYCGVNSMNSIRELTECYD